MGREWTAEDVKAEVNGGGSSLWHILEPALADSKEWVAYEGERGGEGWRNTETGEIVYQDEKPGSDGDEGSDGSDLPSELDPSNATSIEQFEGGRSGGQDGDIKIAEMPDGSQNILKPKKEQEGKAEVAGASAVRALGGKAPQSAYDDENNQVIQEFIEGQDPEHAMPETDSYVSSLAATSLAGNADPNVTNFTVENDGEVWVTDADASGYSLSEDWVTDAIREEVESQASEMQLSPQEAVDRVEKEMKEAARSTDAEALKEELSEQELSDTIVENIESVQEDGWTLRDT